MKTNTYAEQQAIVRIGRTLCDQEKEFTAARLVTVQKALEAIMEKSLTKSQIPRIALATSGGGIRAMFASIGMLQGATIPLETNDNHSPLNLLDITTYFSALSGSTWTVTGLSYSHMNPGDFLAHMSSQMEEDILENFDMIDLTQALEKKQRQNQPISFVDVYGILIAQKIFKKIDPQNPSAIELSAYANKIDSTKMPLPIQTAVISDEYLSSYEWVEFTPYEIGSTALNSFVPIWAFGRKFNKGNSIDFTPPQSIGFCLGTWSSAMCLNAKDFFDLIIKAKINIFFDKNITPQFGVAFSYKLKKSLKRIILYFTDMIWQLKKIIYQNKGNYFKKNISPATFFNWTFGIKNTPLNKRKTITLVDAGLSFNIPLPPLIGTERVVNIIIICDASDGNDQLALAEQYAKKHNLKFPPIDYNKINQICSIHQDYSDQDVPIIIYMPLIKNINYQNNWDPYSEKFTATFNTKYTQEQSIKLSGLMKYNMEQSMPLILNTIKQWIEKKAPHQ